MTLMTAPPPVVGFILSLRLYHGDADIADRCDSGIAVLALRIDRLRVG
ncbi:hypothetical protein [Bifidobacterium jacchi]|nr:hypothetical protein [Bifidobacterium jacchi]